MLAYVTIAGRGETDDLIARAVARLAAGGLLLAGTVRAAAADPGGHPCDMDLRVLPDGPAFRISQPLGRGARGCRLDGGVIAAIAAEVEARLPGADLLVVNKFGKQEALGRGLCPAIAMAMDSGIPVLVGVNAMNLPGLLAFAGGLAEPLAPTAGAVCAWAGRAGARPRLAPLASG